MNKLTDDEDYDNQILDDKNRDPTVILQDVPESVDIHQYDKEEELTQARGKKKFQISHGKRLNLIFQNFHHKLLLRQMKECNQ